MPRFSVIIPVFNTEPYLACCAESVLSQGFGDFEIILVNDGSTDDSPSLCDALAQKDPRISVIHKANGGLSHARNTGLAAATGQYVLFLDSDDVFFDDALEKLAYFADGVNDILVFDGECSDGSKKLFHHHVKSVCNGKTYLRQALSKNRMPMASWLYGYRREFLEKNGLEFKNGILHEDEQFTPRAFLCAERVADTGARVYGYCVRQGSITQQKDLRRNCAHLTETCFELKQIYDSLEDEELKNLLLDSLVTKYLSLMQDGKLYRYGKPFVQKAFVKQNAKSRKNKAKALLFCLSPRLYWQVNNIAKK